MKSEGANNIACCHWKKWRAHTPMV